MIHGISLSKGLKGVIPRFISYASLSRAGLKLSALAFSSCGPLLLLTISLDELFAETMKTSLVLSKSRRSLTSLMFIRSQKVLSRGMRSIRDEITLSRHLCRLGCNWPVATCTFRVRKEWPKIELRTRIGKRFQSALKRCLVFGEWVLSRKAM